MANQPKVRYKSFLPGGGHDSSGGAKQGKTRVVGSIAVTSYQNAGESLSAADLGLQTIDYIDLSVQNPLSGGSADTTTAIYTARYEYTFSAFYVYTHTLATGAITNVDAATHNLRFVAEGDSASVADIQ